MCKETIALCLKPFTLKSLLLYSASKKTTKFSVFDKKGPNTRLSKFLKSRSLQEVNDCFKNESNAVVGVFLQRLITCDIKAMTGFFFRANTLPKPFQCQRKLRSQSCFVTAFMNSAKLIEPLFFSGLMVFRTMR
jgi:hypothetical protein